MEVLLMTAALLAFGFGGLFLGVYAGKDKMKQQCIERGLAQYNPITAEWEWIEKKEVK